MPVIDPVFEPPPDDPEDRADVARLHGDLQDQLDRAATHAFSNSFLIAAVLALLALLPIALARRRGAEPVSGRALVIGSFVASAALVIVYLAAGGSSYAPAKVRDPCEPRAWRDPTTSRGPREQFTLSALDGTACELHVTRETLIVALATPEARERFTRALRSRTRAGPRRPRRPAEGDRRRRGGGRAQPADRDRPSRARRARPGRRAGSPDPGCGAAVRGGRAARAARRPLGGLLDGAEGVLP